MEKTLVKVGRQVPVHIIAHGSYPLCGLRKKVRNSTDIVRSVGRDRKQEATCPDCIRREGQSVNETHPELRKGEMWLMNIAETPGPGVIINGREYDGPQTEFIAEAESSYRELSWRTKRLGKIGYNYLGVPNGSVPVFIKKQEYGEHSALD